MRLKKKTKRTLKFVIVFLLIGVMLLPLVTYFIPQEQSNQIDPKLLEAMLEAQNETPDDGYDLPATDIPVIEGTYQVTDVPAGNVLTILYGDEEKEVKLIGVKPIDRTQKALEKKIKNELVQLEFDSISEDENGNLLVYAYHTDGTFLNYDLILHGDAKVDTKESENVGRMLELEDAQVLAKNNEAGAWAEDEVETGDKIDR